jgi:hypothetical protein
LPSMWISAWPIRSEKICFMLNSGMRRYLMIVNDSGAVPRGANR